MQISRTDLRRGFKGHSRLYFCENDCDTYRTFLHVLGLLVSLLFLSFYYDTFLVWDFNII